MSDFVHLHVHSHYSLLEALPKVDELVRAAKKMGMTALALTDYGSLYGAIEFYKVAKRAGLKPIIGLEAYVASRSRFEKNHQAQEVYHLILLAENETGYRNLMKLSSMGHLEGFGPNAEGDFVPRLDKDLLEKYHEGIIALSGCLQGEIPQLIYEKRDLDAARRAAVDYGRLFGPEHFYLELQDHPDLPGQIEVNNALIRLAEETNLPLVVSRDVHYLSLEDREAQDVVTCIRTGRTVNDSGRSNFLSVDRSFNSAQDIGSRFRHVASALANTVKIAERCNLELKLGKWNFPPVAIPAGLTSDEVLENEAKAGLARLIEEVTPEIQARFDYELGVIRKKGYAPYFLAVADYVRWSRDNGIIVTTRGSAAGSLISYLIGIITINPLYFKLPFERFLNPHRPSPPDIDVDFADNRRDEVIAYVTQKYGADRVAQVITFGTMMARASVRDVGRALGYSYSFCDQVAKMIPLGSQGFPMTIAKAISITPELFALYNENPQAKRLLDLAQKIEGGARHTSVHAAGVVIAPAPLTDFTPIQRETGGERIITQYEMHSVEEAGLLKMDFLGIRNLSILGDAVKIVQKTRGVSVNLANIPWDDPETYAMLSRGETGGLFQLGGTGMTRYLEELQPSGIFDIMAMVALFRPGPMDSIPEFIRRKHNAKLISYLDPRMEDYLDKSYGVITYQDDVLLTAINIAGYTWEEADKLRKAMGKKIPEEMAAQQEKFISGCLKNGLKIKKANELWELIEPFAAYGFNKAHAASYAVIAYQTAYLKAHFPEEYMAAVLSAEAADLDKVSENVAECKKMGIVVLPPDVNESFELFAVVPRKNEADKPTIRFGLRAIKNVGQHIAEKIIKERKANGPYQGLEDFLSRVQDKDLNKKSLESLIKCGALDRFGERGQFLANIELLTSFTRDSQRESQTNQNSLFDLGGTATMSRLYLKPAGAAKNEEKLAWEKELIGLYISQHPFTAMVKKLGPGFLPLNKIFERHSTDPWILACGLLASAKHIITKKGEFMLFAGLEDETTKVEVVVFPRVYQQYKNLLQPGQLVCFVGKIDEREEGKEKKVIAEKVEVLNDETIPLLKERYKEMLGGERLVHQEAEREVWVQVDSALTPELVEELKKLWQSQPGTDPVFVIAGQNGQKRKIATGFSVCFMPDLKKEMEKLLGERAKVTLQTNS